MKKIYIISAIVIFVLTTVIVMLSDTSSRKKISFTNRNFIFKNEGTEVKNENVDVNLNKSSITNKSVNLNDTGINNQQTGFDNRHASYNDTGFNNQETDYQNQENSLNPEYERYQNQEVQLNNARNRINNINNRPENPNPNADKYVYKNVNWNQWRSNFVNRIIDDSMYIKSLDNYPIGSMFYYSFIVTSSGNVLNIKVKSTSLTDVDKMRIEKLIKSYAYTPITNFPENSRRASAKVEAIVMLGPSEEKSKPSDFNDFERIKTKL